MLVDPVGERVQVTERAILLRRGPDDLLQQDGDATPRRPAVYSESSTATSSFVTTVAISMSDPRTSSTAISKFITSPV